MGLTTGGQPTEEFASRGKDWADPNLGLPRRDGQTPPRNQKSERYASYWNAFLLENCPCQGTVAFDFNPYREIFIQSLSIIVARHTYLIYSNNINEFIACVTEFDHTIRNGYTPIGNGSSKIIHSSTLEAPKKNYF